MQISGKQKEMLAFIEGFMEENRYPPTLEEIRTGMEISSKSLVNYHLTALENADCLSRSPNKSRGIRLANDSDLVRVPVVNEINTLISDTAQENAIELTSDIVPNRDDLCALKVQDDSLIDAFVNEGDVIVLQRQDQASNGDMVVVRVPDQDQPLMRRYYRENGQVELHPADPTVQSLKVMPHSIDIQGKVVAVIRRVE